MSDDVRLIDVIEDSRTTDLPAGTFLSWLRDTRRALRDNTGADVACGECNACCRSSYFIHIDLRETETLQRIPRELLFDAPGRAEGHVVMGYDENGCCPMLIDGACSIYEHRPQTCRNYDCRIFAAAGVTVGDENKASVRHSQRWKFDYPQARDRQRHDAVKAATEFLRGHSEFFDAGVARNSTQLAMSALKVHEVFLSEDNDEPDHEKPEHEIAALVEAVLGSEAVGT